MSIRQAEMTLKLAREVLGVSSLSTPAEIQRAYRLACKRAHPDHGGDEHAFHQVTEAYRRLTEGLKPPAPQAQPRRPDPPVDDRLTITPQLAANGGVADHRLPSGRRLRITLPAGLRSGDRIRAADAKLEVYVRAEAGVLVRGDDLWMTVHVHPTVLKRGGRVTIDAPQGKTSIWITRAAAERGLIKLDSQGLPARGRHAAGHLYVRLAAEADSANDSLALTLLRRFAAAWAA